MQEQQINNKYHSPISQQLSQQELKLNAHQLLSQSSATLQLNEQAAKKRLKQLYRHLPFSFFPKNIDKISTINDNKSTNSFTLYGGSPIFRANSLLYDRERLSIERQLMYCRAALSQQIIDHNIVETYIEQNRRGFVHKEGNKSLIVGGLLVYVDGAAIKAIRLPECKTQHNAKLIQLFRQSINPITLYQFGQGTRVLQIGLFSTNNFSNKLSYNFRNNSNRLPFSHFCPSEKKISKKQVFEKRDEQVLILVRLSRQILVLSVFDSEIVHRMQNGNSQEFVCCQNNIYYPQGLVETVKYNQQDSIIQQYSLYEVNNNISSTNKQQPNRHSAVRVRNQLVNSLSTISKNQTLFSTYRTLQLCDYRQKTPLLLYHVNNLSNHQYHHTNQRIYSALKITANYTFSPYFLTCQTRHISLFDIRNPSQPISKTPHHSEQSPPQAMQYFDGFEHKLSQPILLCSSLYNQGMTIMTRINLDSPQGFNTQIQPQSNKSNIIGKHFQLISTSNYANNQPNFLTEYPNSYSLSAHNYSSQLLALFQTGNQGRVKVNLYSFNNVEEKYQPTSILVQQSQTQLTKIQSKQQAHTSHFDHSQKWFKNNLCQKYFTQKVTYQNTQSKINKKNKSKQKNLKNQSKQKKLKNQKQEKSSKSKSNKKRKNHSHNQQTTNQKHKSYLLNNLNNNDMDSQNLTIQDIVLEKDEYQNEQQCQFSFSQRKLNFSDFSQFYQTLKTKAQHYKYKPPHLQPISHKSIPFQTSLTSTLSLSNEAFSLSKSFQQNQQKTTPFQMQKFTLKPSIINRLKNSWNSQ